MLCKWAIYVNYIQSMHKHIHKGGVICFKLWTPHTLYKRNRIILSFTIKSNRNWTYTSFVFSITIIQKDKKNIWRYYHKPTLKSYLPELLSMYLKTLEIYRWKFFSVGRVRFSAWIIAHLFPIISNFVLFFVWFCWK